MESCTTYFSVGWRYCEPASSRFRLNSKTIEPGWAPYVAVTDLGATLEKVKDLGGRVIFGETDHPVDASVALIMDPSGAVLFIYQIGSHEEAK